MPLSEAVLESVHIKIGIALEALDKEATVAAQCNEADPACSRLVTDSRSKIRQELQAAKSHLGRCGAGDACEAFDNVADNDTRAWLKSAFAAPPQKMRARKGSVASSNGDNRTSMAAYLKSDAQLVQALEDNAEVAALLGRAGEFDFDALGFGSHPDVGGKPLSMLGVHLELRQKLVQRMHDGGRIASGLEDFQLAFLAFLSKLDVLYKPDAIYHGAAHAADVMSTAMWFMRSEYLASNSKSIDSFTVMVAAASHDVGHPGVNNLFLINTMDPLALRYNDKSVLENMHVALAFETMAAHTESNWFQMLDATGKKQVRPGMVGMILATDMATHANMNKSLESFDTEKKDLTFLYETVIHCADITNPAKPKPQMLRWTKLITEEFWTQGDQEQKLGLEISPLCERESGMKTVPKGQIGFINFVVLPYITQIQRVLPEASVATDGLGATKEHWEKASRDQLTYEQIFKDVL